MSGFEQIPIADQDSAAAAVIATQLLYVHLVISAPKVLPSTGEYSEGRTRTDFIRSTQIIGMD